MLSSKSLRFSSVIPSALTKWHSSSLAPGIREISGWGYTKQYCEMSMDTQSCTCNHNAFRKPNIVIGQTFLKTFPRYFSTGKGQEDVPYAAPDHDDMYDVDESDHVNNRRSKDENKVRVKFNWKNSLVSTDSIKLLENLYQSHPQLIDFNENELVNYLQLMSYYTIDVEKAAKMVIMNPRLLKTPEDSISSCITALRSIGLNESQRSHILRSIPQLFTFPSKRIVDQFVFLKTYFSKDESISVVSKSVDVFLESETTLRNKLEYLIKDMSHETKNLINCKAISYPLKHIRTRHEFLIRAGFFTPIPYRKLIKVLEKEYKDRNKPRSKYFKPIEVVCFNDKDFLTACTKNLLSLNELAAFEELFGAELKVREDNYEEEDDEEFDLRPDEDDEDEEFRGTASLVKSPNSTGFFSDNETKSVYF